MRDFQANQILDLIKNKFSKNDKLVFVGTSEKSTNIYNYINPIDISELKIFISDLHICISINLPYKIEQKTPFLNKNVHDVKYILHIIDNRNGYFYNEFDILTDFINSPKFNKTLLKFYYLHNKNHVIHRDDDEDFVNKYYILTYYNIYTDKFLYEPYVLKEI